ncbi:hypothetical protein [Haloferax sp. KTX1]|uniref:DUF7269 family protein n=1 Tax=Haloferax sp. KTX1 TaxID=2600597 RepID=UPI0011DC86CA|nr:hypothetical protein [Haloferax sp. KTX1]
MTLTRRLFLLVGVVATVAGFAAVAGVSLGLELTDVFLGLVAALAALQGLRYVQRRRDSAPNTTVTGDPEARATVPIPGSDFDDDLVSAAGRHTRWAARQRVVDRLETRATEALVARGGHAPEEAAALLKTGGWTDDPVAARFLGASVSVPLRQRVRLFLSGKSSLADRAERTVAAIERVGTADGPAGDRR